MNPIGMLRPKNILIIKLRHIGDVLLSTPVLHALREAFPEAQLTMLVNRGTEGVLAHNPDVNEVLCLEKGAWADQCRFVYRLRERGFDCVIDLTDGDRSAARGRESSGTDSTARSRSDRSGLLARDRPGVAARRATAGEPGGDRPTRLRAGAGGALHRDGGQPVRRRRRAQHRRRLLPRPTRRRRRRPPSARQPNPDPAPILW